MEDDKELGWSSHRREQHFGEKMKEVMNHPQSDFNSKIVEIRSIVEQYTASYSKMRKEIFINDQANELHEFYILLVKAVKQQLHGGEDISPANVQAIFMDILENPGKRGKFGGYAYPHMVNRWRRMDYLHGMISYAACCGPDINHRGLTKQYENFDWNHTSAEVLVFYKALFDDTKLCANCYEQYASWHDHNKKMNGSSEDDETESRNYAFDDYSCLPSTYQHYHYKPNWNVCAIYPTIIDDLKKYFTKEQRMLSAQDMQTLADEIVAIPDAMFVRRDYVNRKHDCFDGFGYHSSRDYILTAIKSDFTYIHSSRRLEKGRRYEFEITPKIAHGKQWHVNIFKSIQK